MATAGNVNGDGYSDVVVGAFGHDAGAGLFADRGRAYLHLGSASGLATSPGWSGSGDENFAGFGFPVATAGDVNGDGYSDVLVAAINHGAGGSYRGRTYLYYGNGGDGLHRIPRQTRTDATTPIALLGKSDSETAFRLRARGLTPAGRGKIRLQWEAKPLGTLFNGAGIGTSAVEDTGVPLPGSAVDFNQEVAASEGTFYHWRLRVTSSNPFFPRSPWISLAGNAVTETKLRTAGCVDRDGDGYGDRGDPSCASLTSDCNDRDAAAWDTPGETVNLRFTSKTALTWNAPVAPGAPLSSLSYDTLRSGIASNFLAGVCVESDDGPNTAATDTATPSAGQAFFYLSRAQNTCPQGVGTLGSSSSGVPRTGRPCP